MNCEYVTTKIMTVIMELHFCSVFMIWIVVHLFSYFLKSWIPDIYSLLQVISIDLRSTQYGGGLGVTVPSGVEVRGKASAKELPYVKILNRVLPQDIRILQWAPVESGFSARFDCQSRTYRYYFPRGDLDVDLMAEAAKRSVDHNINTYCLLKEWCTVNQKVSELFILKVDSNWVDNSVPLGMQVWGNTWFQEHL